MPTCDQHSALCNNGHELHEARATITASSKSLSLIFILPDVMPIWHHKKKREIMIGRCALTTNSESGYPCQRKNAPAIEKTEQKDSKVEHFESKNKLLNWKISRDTFDPDKYIRTTGGINLTQCQKLQKRPQHHLRDLKKQKPKRHILSTVLFRSPGPMHTLRD